MKLGCLIIFIISLSSSTLSYSQDSICKYDTNRFVELLQTGFPYKTYDTISFAERSRLTGAEKCIIQRLLINLFAKNQDSLPYSFSDYKIQIVSALDSNGRKFAWVNGICNVYLQAMKIDWRKAIVRTADGGECFFQGIIDLKKENIIHIMFNGEAKIKKLNRLDTVQECDATVVK